ncbi:unnamed protein product, partial [Scytosiphon promiscuus]
VSAPACTCLRSLTQAAKLKEGDRVMVLGGSGGVGSSLVQLAKDAKV